MTDIDFGAITAACEHLDNNGMAAAADAIRALGESRDALLGHIGDLAERCDNQAATITGLQGERDLWHETAMKLKDRIANQPDQRERIHIVAAELRNLTARVEGYEQAANDERATP